MRRPKRRLMAAPPTSTGICKPRRASSLTISGICFEVLTSSADNPMASAWYLQRFVDDGIGGDLFAQIVYRVTVVAEDGFDQVLTDVVHIAVNRR